MRWLRRLWRKPAGRELAKYTVIERTEHRTLIQVTSVHGVYRYWIPNQSLNVTFTPKGVQRG